MSGSTDIPWRKIAIGTAIATSAVAVGYYAYSYSFGKKKEKPPIAIISPHLTQFDKAKGSLDRQLLIAHPLNLADSPKFNANSLKNEGNELFKNADYEKALEMYTKAIEICPKNQKNELSTFYQNRAAAYEKLEKFDLVIDDCSSAIVNNKRYTKAYLRRAKIHEKMHDYQEALEDYTTACILSEFVEWLVLEADRVLKLLAEKEASRMHQARGEHQLAVSPVLFDTYLSSFCEDPILNSIDHDQLPPADQPTSAYDEARLAIKDRRFDQVVGHLTREIDMDIASGFLLESLLLRATVAYIQGNSAMAVRDFDRFFQLFDQLSEQEQTARKKLHTTAYVKRATFYLQLGRRIESMGQFEAAELVDGQNADIFHHRGQLLVLLQEYEQAGRDFARSVALRPDFTIGKVQCCYTDYRKAVFNNDHDSLTSAIVRLEKTVADFPQCSEGLALLGQVYVEQGGFDDAVVMFDKALKVQNNANIYVHKGLLELQRAGEYVNEDVLNLARDLMQQAISVDPHVEFAYETLGTLEVNSGNIRQAIEYFDRALNLARTELEMAHLFGLKQAAYAQIAAAERLGYPLRG